MIPDLTAKEVGSESESASSISTTLTSFLTAGAGMANTFLELAFQNISPNKRIKEKTYLFQSVRVYISVCKEYKPKFVAVYSLVASLSSIGRPFPETRINEWLPNSS